MQWREFFGDIERTMVFSPSKTGDGQWSIFLIFRDPIEEGSSIFSAQKDVPCWSTFLMYTLVFF
jgi:hypothetical protein